MTIQHQVIADLQLRATLLPKETELWKEKTKQDVEGMGIHRKQVETINLLLDSLQAKLNSSLNALAQVSEPGDFAHYRIQAENTLTGCHGIAAIFRYMLTQRLDSLYRTALKVADLVAADCYLPIIKQAQKWDVLDKDRFREPPLTYLHTSFSPIALTRRHYLNKAGLEIDGNLDLKLPIGVIALPFHQTGGMWTYCSIYHEVGHLLDQDFGLRGAFRPLLEARLKAVNASRTAVWNLWLPELIADTFGVLLGGAAFVNAMASILFYPSHKPVTIETTDVHPPNALRPFLLTALLRATKVEEFYVYADAIEKTWRAAFSSLEKMESFIGDCEAVADTLLNQRLLVTLKNHCLKEFAPTQLDNSQLVVALAQHLRGKKAAPASQSFPVRLVPAAAQVAVDTIEPLNEVSLGIIQQRALEYIGTIPQPQFMDISGFSASRRAYLRGLVQELDLGAPYGMKGD